MGSRKHTVDTAQLIINKSYNFIRVVSVTGGFVVLEDSKFGVYKACTKILAPSTSIPLHKDRRKLDKYEKARNKLINNMINGFLVVDVFIGKDEGYANRGVFVKYKQSCGHIGIGTPTSLKYITEKSCNSAQ